jgi:DnaJ-class molecular chaperone
MSQPTNPKLAKAAEPEDWSDKFPAKVACQTCDGSGKIPESNPQGNRDRKTCWKCNAADAVAQAERGEDRGGQQ